MSWKFKVNQDGASNADTLMEVSCETWRDVVNVAYLTARAANSVDPVLGYKPPKMTADVIDADGNEILNLGGRNTWEVPQEPPQSQNRPRMRM